MLKIEKQTVFCFVSGEFNLIKSLDKKLTLPLKPEEVSNLRSSPAYDLRGNSVSLLISPDNRFLTGLLPHVEKILKGLEIDYQVVDSSELKKETSFSIDYIQGLSNNILPGITLYDYQLSTIVKSLIKLRGVVSSPTGSGKTEILAALCKLLTDLGKRILIVVNKKALMTQTVKRFRSYGLDAGSVGDNTKDVDHSIVVGISNSLYNAIAKKDKAVFPVIRDFDVLLLDECHHSPCETWSIIGINSNASIKIGVSATPFSDLNNPDLNDLVLMGLTGDIICDIPIRYLYEHGYLVKPYIYFHNINKPNLWMSKNSQWTYVYKKAVTDNDYRNTEIVRLAEELFNHDRKVLIMTRQVQHGELLLEKLKAKNLSCAFYHGTGTDGDEDVEAKLSHAFDNGKNNIVIATTGIGAEGVDIPVIDAMINAAGGASRKIAIQMLGRSLRLYKGKKNAVFIDFFDLTHFYLKNHSRLRHDLYSSEGHQIIGSLSEFWNNWNQL